MRMVLPAMAGAAIAALAATVGAETRQTEPIPFLGQFITAEQIAQGEALYAENCAACHGAELEGAPDWRRRNADGRMPAPPHDASGHTWHHSDRDLFMMTRLGVGSVIPGYQSDMPAFDEVLSDTEIVTILAYIKSTWPERQRKAQAKITASQESGQ